ncbi:MAG: NAD(P)-dependent oxidoreductase, partial [Mesorhizobium sp.]
GEEVVVADIVKSDLPHYRSVRYIKCDVTEPASVSCVGVRADDMVYNLSAKMLSPIQVRAKRHDFFFPVNFHGTEHIIKVM